MMNKERKNVQNIIGILQIIYLINDVLLKIKFELSMAI